MEQATAHDPLLGAHVGNYVVQHKLGEGGMGSVYLAVHPKIGKKVALKVLHAEFSSNEDVVARFFNEAKAVNDIQHPNIVDIIDYGTLDTLGGGQPVVYFIMEFLGGDSLAKTIVEQAPLAPERAQAIALQIADALGASHRQGIVHRDLKPDNVMLSVRRDGRDSVKVLDFGIAKLTGDQPGSRRTRTGIVMGTPAYMSPEQCEGRGQIDHRTDIYALGILLYEMLTGVVPFQGEGYGEVLVQHMTQMPQKPSTIRGVIPPHLEAVCMKALEKRADDRFQTMDEVVKALADPVAYVESHGGLEGFVTYNLGAPTSFPTPYPAAHAPYATPSPLHGSGQIPPVGAAPGYIPAASSQAYAAPAQGPRPGGNNTVKLAIAGVVAVALGVGGFLGYRAMSGSKDSKAAAAAGATDAAPAGIAADTPTSVEVSDAAPIEPKKPPEPKVPDMIKVVVESNPPGADVYVAGEGKPRGVTPFSFDLHHGVNPVWVRLVAKGYEERREKIIPTENRNLDLQLTKVERKSSGSRGGKSGNRGGKSGTKKTKQVGDNTLRPTF